jgi:hypothetical protein
MHSICRFIDHPVVLSVPSVRLTVRTDSPTTTAYVMSAVAVPTQLLLSTTAGHFSLEVVMSSRVISFEEVGDGPIVTVSSVLSQAHVVVDVSQLCEPSSQGCSVGAWLGEAVGSEEGAVVGVIVGTGEGASVGNADGAAVEMHLLLLSASLMKPSRHKHS